MSKANDSNSRKLSESALAIQGKAVIDFGENHAKGSSSKTPVAKPDGTKMFCSAFLNDARMCCFFANTIVKH